MDFLILCIGNKYGGDDGIGPYVAEKLKKEKISDMSVIDCGTNPENYTSVIKSIRPKKLIIIDAVEMNLKPGEIRLIKKEKIGVMHISTHNIPISLLINYLEKYVGEIIFIGIQPKKMSGNMSLEIKKSSDLLINNIINQDFDLLKYID